MKLSVVISTRERADVLGAALASCAAVDCSDLEIVVSDNASGDDTRADPRVVYTTTGRRVSMRLNFEHALSCAIGDYVLFMGADDALLARQSLCCASAGPRRCPTQR